MDRRHPVIHLILVACCLLSVVSVAACGGGRASGSGKVRSTVVVNVRPWTAKGVAAKLKVRTGHGSCLGSSQVAGRTDSYRCAAGNRIFDPCLASPYPSGAGKVACPTSPREVEVVTVSGRLPDQSNRPGQDQVWMLVLADGDQCNRRSGAGLDARGSLTSSMGCRSGSLVWGEPHHSGRVWTVQVSRTAKGTLSTAQVAQAFR